MSEQLPEWLEKELQENTIDIEVPAELRKRIMNEEERQSVIDLINQAPEGVRMFAHAAYLLGHEDGWWLNRTDPDVTINPADHARKVNPFVLSPELTDLIEKAKKLDPDPQD